MAKWLVYIAVTVFFASIALYYLFSGAYRMAVRHSRKVRRYKFRLLRVCASASLVCSWIIRVCIFAFCAEMAVAAVIVFFREPTQVWVYVAVLILAVGFYLWFFHPLVRLQHTAKQRLERVKQLEKQVSAQEARLISGDYYTLYGYDVQNDGLL